MSALSDRHLRKRINSCTPQANDRQNIGIRPCEDSQIQPASVDLTLFNEFMAYDDPDLEAEFESEYAVDMDDVQKVKAKRYICEKWILKPREFVLGSTQEYVEIPDDLQGSVHGKSSLARIGLLVHATAGFIDPGFKGRITLEMYNLNSYAIVLRAFKPICQISLFELTSPAARPYGHPDLGSHYQGQKTVQPSLYDGRL